MLVYLRCKELLKDSRLRARLCSLGQQPEQFCMLVCREQNRGFGEGPAEYISRMSLANIINMTIIWAWSSEQMLLRSVYHQLTSIGVE